MNTKVRHLYPTKDFPLMSAGSEGLPLRHLEALVQDALRIIKAGAVTDEDKARVEREANSARVYGIDNITITYVDELTPIESLNDKIAEQESVLSKVRDVLNNREVSKDQLDNLRRTFGIVLNPEGTPASPVGEANPYPAGPVYPLEEDRKASFMWYFNNSGFKIPDNIPEIKTDIKNRGWKREEVEQWLGLENGFLS